MWLICLQDILLLSFPRDGEQVLDTLPPGCTVEASCKLLYEGRIWIKVCRGGVSGPTTGQLLKSVAYMLDAADAFARLPGPALPPLSTASFLASSTSPPTTTTTTTRRRIVRRKRRVRSSRSSFPHTLQGASAQSCLYALTSACAGGGIDAFSAPPSGVVSIQVDADADLNTCASRAAVAQVVGRIPSFSVVEVDRHLIDRRSNQLWGHIRHLPKINSTNGSTKGAVSTTATGNEAVSGDMPTLSVAAAAAEPTAGQRTETVPSGGVNGDGGAAQAHSVLSDTEQYILEMQQKLGSDKRADSTAFRGDDKKTHLSSSAALNSGESVDTGIDGDDIALDEQADEPIEEEEDEDKEDEEPSAAADPQANDKGAWVCLSTTVADAPSKDGGDAPMGSTAKLAFTLLDVPLGAPWCFRNVFEKNAGRLPVRIAPRLDAPVLEYLPAFISVQTRSTVLTPDGQLWVRLSPQFKPFVDGYVIQTNASNGAAVLEPFALNNFHRLRQQYASTGKGAESVQHSRGLRHYDGDCFIDEEDDGTSSDSDDDGFGLNQELCFRNVLKKAALPFREDPELASPVVTRLPLGGCLRGGQRLITKEGQLWAQCFLRRVNDGAGYEPVWAVERNARDGTPILERIRAPQRLLHDGRGDEEAPNQQGDSKENVEEEENTEGNGKRSESEEGTSATDEVVKLVDENEEEDDDEVEVEGENMVDRLARLRRNKERQLRRREKSGAAKPKAEGSTQRADTAKAKLRREKERAEAVRRRKEERQRKREQRKRQKKGLVYRVLHQGALPVLNTPGFGEVGTKELDELSAGDIFIGVERRLNDTRNPPSMWVGFYHHRFGTPSTGMERSTSIPLAWVPESIGGVGASIEEVRGVAIGMSPDEIDFGRTIDNGVESGSLVGAEDDKDDDDAHDYRCGTFDEEFETIHEEDPELITSEAADMDRAGDHQAAPATTSNIPPVPQNDVQDRSGSSNEAGASPADEDSEANDLGELEGILAGGLNNDDDDEIDKKSSDFAAPWEDEQTEESGGMFGDFTDGFSGKNTSSVVRRAVSGGEDDEEEDDLGFAFFGDDIASATTLTGDLPKELIVSPEEEAKRLAAKEEEAKAKAEAQVEAAEKRKVAGEKQLKDLLDALDSFADEDAQREADRKRRQLERKEAMLYAESAHLRATTPPVMSPLGNWYFGALTVRLRPHTASRDARSGERKAAKKKSSSLSPPREVIGGGVELDDYDYDENVFDEMDDDEFEKFWMGREEDDAVDESFATDATADGSMGIDGAPQRRKKGKGARRNDVTIYYTTDGTLPNPRFALTMPLTIQVGPGVTVIRAMAVKAGMEPSPVVSARYVVYGWEAPAPALKCALDLHHTLFKTQLVQRVRRRIFWPRRRGASGAKRSAYANLSVHESSFDEDDDEVSDNTIDTVPTTPRSSRISTQGDVFSGGEYDDYSEEYFTPTFVSPGSQTPGSKVSGMGGSRGHPGDRESSPFSCCVRGAVSAVAFVIRKCQLRGPDDRAGYGSIGDYSGDL